MKEQPYKYTYPALLLLCLIAFFPVFKAGFINYDDPEYVINNPYIQQFSLENIKAIFAGKATVLYVPLTVLSYLPEYSVFGAGAKSFHVINLLLHMANALLLYRILLRLKIKNEYLLYFILVFFSINPLLTESVCWVTERKDMLYCLFAFSATLQFLKYNEQKKHKALLLCLLYFIMACLSKPMAITLPALFLLYLIYSNGKSELKKFLFLLPFLFVSVIFSAIAVFSIKQDTTQKIVEINYDPGEQLYLYVSELGYYFFKPFFPLNQQLINIFPEADALFRGKILLFFILGILLVAGIAYAVFKQRIRPMGFLLVAWLIFLLPVLQIYSNTHSYVSERYFYVSIIFPVTMAFVFLSSCKIKQSIYKGVLGVTIPLFVCLTFIRSTAWKNPETLFTAELKEDGEDPLALNNLGYYYNSLSQFNRGVPLLKKAVGLDPDNAAYLNNYGWSLAALGNTDSAIVYFQKALNIHKTYAEAMGNLGIAYINKNMDKKAFYYFNEAYKLKPDNNENLYNLGAYYLKTGQKEKAIPLLRRSYELGNKQAGKYLQ